MLGKCKSNILMSGVEAVFVTFFHPFVGVESYCQRPVLAPASGPYLSFPRIATGYVRR
jgi:hypothetical protein